MLFTHRLRAAAILLFIFTVVLESYGISKGCYYKGTYHHGNWTDGCEFNCSCIDADAGYYKCHIRCTVYPQLRNGCVLKLPLHEECCKQPDCSALTSYYNIQNGGNDDSNSTTKKIVHIKLLNETLTDNAPDNGTERGCLYKGQYHSGNWTDGCEFNCSCEDPIMGIYECRKRCREYPKLDPGCILTLPPSEECCSEPVCNSSDIFINDNINYTDTKPQRFTAVTNEIELPPEVMPVLLRMKDLPPEGNSSSDVHGNINDSLNDTTNVPYNTINTTAVEALYENGTESNNVTETERLAISFSKFGPMRLFSARKYKPDINFPTMNGEYHNTNGDHPTTNREYISTKGDHPISNRGYISTNGDHPITNREYLSTNGDHSITNREYLSTNGDHPITNREYLSTNVDHPITNREYLSTNGEYLATNREHSATTATNGEFPTTNGIEDELNHAAMISKEAFNNRNNGKRTINIPNSNGNEIASSEKIIFESGGTCMYKGYNFSQGEQWYDGCDITCACENATRGFYKCRSRCQKYNPVPVSCVMRRSKIDNCCLVPDCRNETVVNDNQRIATSRILSEIRQPTKTGKLTLIKMFNRRMETRNNIHSDQLLGPSRIQNIPIISKADNLDRRKLQTDGENISFGKANTNEHSTSLLKQATIKDKRTDNRIPDKIRITSDINGLFSNETKFAENVQLKQDFRSLHNQNTALKPKLVTRYIENKSHLSSNTVNAMGHEGNTTDQQLFRALKTETGIYKVKIKDGTISAYIKPISVGLSRMLGAIAAGESFTEQSKNTLGECIYKEVRYTEGETWFDGCEFSCTCQDKGQHACQQRCTEYTHVPTGCTLVTPRVGECCNILVCPRVIPNRNHPVASITNFY